MAMHEQLIVTSGKTAFETEIRGSRLSVLIKQVGFKFLSYITHKKAAMPKHSR
jgi:hypothetical protein